MTTPAPAVTRLLALFYDCVPDYATRREPYRDAHLAHITAARDSGALVMAGALDDPLEAALLVFRDDRANVEAFAAADPYVQNGVVTRWTVRGWNVVAGAPA